MNINKAVKRDRKRQRNIHGHQEDGRSVKLIKEIQKKKSLRIKKQIKIKETLLGG